MSRLRWLVACLLCITIFAGPARAAHASPVFTPSTGFGGHSEGTGTLRLFLGRQRAFHVVSHGVEQPDGMFRLDQSVTFEGKPAKQRHWLISTTGPNEYSATLSDAAGPVSGHTQGARLLLRYRAKGPLVMHQTLRLLPDGRTIDNVGRITLLGIPVGRLHETITRRDPTPRSAQAAAANAR